MKWHLHQGIFPLLQKQKAIFLVFRLYGKKPEKLIITTRVINTSSLKLNAWVNGNGRCITFGVPTVCRVPSNKGTDCYFDMVLLFKILCPWRKHQHLFSRIYHRQSCRCLMAMYFLFLNLQTIFLCTLTMKTLFLQIAKNSSHQLQEIQSTCQAQTLPSIGSKKSCWMTWTSKK